MDERLVRYRWEEAAGKISGFSLGKIYATFNLQTMVKSKMFDCAVAMLENEDITNDAVRDKLETLSEINGIIGDINKGIHSRKEHSKK